MFNWNYESKIKRSSGYEDDVENLKKYTSDLFNSVSEEDKEKMIEEVFNIYRSKNIYPII